MIKRKFLTLLRIAIAVVLMTGCGETKNEIYPEVAPKINLSEGSLSSELLMKSESQSVTVSFTSNVPWHATVSTDWVSLSSYSGKAGNESILINVTENKTFQSRTAVVTISDEEDQSKVSVKITQDAMTASLTVEPESLSFTSQGGSESFMVTSNAKWMISKDADWVILDSEEGQNDANIKVTVLENRDLTSRTGTIKVSTSDEDMTQNILVQQEGADVVFSVDESEINLSATGESFTVRVSHNIGYRIDSWPDWVKQTSKTSDGDVDTYTFEAEANIGTKAREGVIAFINDNNERIAVNVQQTGADATLYVSPASVTIQAKAETKSISVRSNTTWTATSSRSWLKLSSTGGDGDSQFSITAEDNAVATPRSAIITFVTTDGKTTAKVEIIQSAADIIFTVNEAEFNVNASGETFSVKVTHNIGYKISALPDWVKQTDKTSAGDVDIYTFSVGANIRTEAREGDIIFINDNNERVSVIVRQTGAESTLSVSPTALTFTAKSESKSISVRSNTAWTAMSSDSWVKLGFTGGSGDLQLAVATEANPMASPRSATITLKTSDGKATAMVKVIQGAADVIFSVDRNEYNVVAAGESFSLKVTHNIGYSIASLPDWVKRIDMSTVGDVDTYTFKTDPNISTQARDGIIVFRNDDNDRLSVIVKQAGADATIAVSPENIDFTSKVESKSISVKSNSKWTAMSSDSWAKLSSTNGSGDSQLSVTVEANTVATPRSATITLKTTDGKATATVKIIQGAADVIFSVDRNEFNVVAAGESISLKVTHNIGYSVASLPDWVKQTDKSTSGNVDTYILKVESNTSTQARKGNIVFHNDNGDRIAVSVKQIGADASISATPADMPFTANAETKSISVISNTTWTAASSDSWVRLSSTSGSGDLRLAVTVEANTVAAPRSATVILKTADGKATATVKVRQSAADVIFSVDRNVFNVVASGEAFSVRVTHNIDYRITSLPEWVKRTDKATNGAVDTYTFEAEANVSTQIREGTIVFRDDNNDRITVTVKQAGAELALVTSPVRLTFKAMSESKSFYVRSNTTWTATPSDSWIKLSTSNGNCNAKLTVTVATNTEAVPRSATITLKTTDGNITVTINVKQEAADPFLSIDKLEFSAESVGATLQVRVTHNIDYKISSKPDWISLSKKVSSGNTDTYTISVYRNTGYKREGQIVFRYNDIDDVVTIRQSGSKKDGGNDDTTTGGKITLE